MSFYFVYVLRNAQKSFIYIGYTENLKNRINKHNNKEVTSTKKFTPLELIHFEGYNSKQDALRREKYLKTNRGRTTLITMLKGYFERELAS